MNYGKRAAMARQATLDSKSTKIRKKVGINALRALLVFIVIMCRCAIAMNHRHNHSYMAGAKLAQLRDLAK